jgi:Mg2+/citrate symporter
MSAEVVSMDTPWSKYYAAFVPNLLACVLCGTGIALTWSPIPAAALYLPIILGTLLFLAVTERRRRQLLQRAEPKAASSEELARWQEFRTARRRERPWFAVFGVFLIVAMFAISGPSLGAFLIAGGVAMWILDVLLVAPWLQSDIEFRLRQAIS